MTSIKTTETKPHAARHDALVSLLYVVNGIVALACVVAVWGVFFPRNEYRDVAFAQRAAPEMPAHSPVPLYVYRPYDEYAQMIRGRDLFTPPWGRGDMLAASSTPEVPLAQSLRVKGIVYDANPTVIVEDIARGTTTFLTRGQTITDATLTDIRPDAAVFLYKGETVELAP